MAVTWCRREFRVELTTYEPWVPRDFNDFDQITVHRTARDAQASGLEFHHIGVIKFVAVPMSFGDEVRAVGARDETVAGEFALLPTEPHGAANITS